MNQPMTPERGTAPDDRSARPIVCPIEVRVERMQAFCNAELTDHPVYDGVEVQRFADPTHGEGLLVFLSRREDRTVDYYLDAGLRLDPSTYAIGGGTGVWTTTRFERSDLEVDARGLRLDVAFTDAEGRHVELRADDRAAGTGRRGVLLAPVGDGIEAPDALMLVHIHGFDLLRRDGTRPVIRIDGRDVATGTLPGAWLHRRHLIKYGGPLSVARLCPGRGPRVLSVDDTTEVIRADAGVATLSDRRDGGAVAVTFEPPLPDLAALRVEHLTTGSWHIEVDDTRVTGGTWFARRGPGDRVELGLDVTERWSPPPGLPMLLRTATRVLPTFRRWPTTYRWRAAVDLDASIPAVDARWERIDDPDDRGRAYRRITS